MIKLEVGKTYVTKFGENVSIVDCVKGCTYPYIGSNGRWFMEDGRWCKDAVVSNRDLVSEYVETPSEVEVLKARIVELEAYCQDNSRQILEYSHETDRMLERALKSEKERDQLKARVAELEAELEK